MNNLKKITINIVLSASCVFGQQLDIPRVEQMPAMPQPYHMRDWKKVATAYDSMVFDFNLTGEYLPLIKMNNNTINYPDHSSFILHTAVGTKSPDNAECINLLPAVIGASLVGINKSDQNGYNWVLMCEEFFNRRPEENVYLNNPVTSSGSDWWYDTMPNIFFYQLYDLYPHTGDFDYQFTTIADRWLAAVERMGGKTTPWNKPYLNYRAFRLSTMLPYSEGVKQPEAAGALAWLLYNAFLVTGEEKFKIGAEWCLEFLNGWLTNPAYELQLPYGVYTAARMNGELNTGYNVEKMLNWSFNPDGNVREWGVTLGKWGSYDCAGLVGEARYEGYAFIMNGFQQAAALVPMVRYDDRFARAIGKWMLNLANATRLFYSNYLPPENQDGETWSYAYDPQSLIAHEAMREKDLDSDNRPFATGDFARSGWGVLNFALYGSSHVGYLASIIDTTDVQMILKLDTRSTDFFQKYAFQTFLVYNPYPVDTTIVYDAGSGLHDLYDAVTNTVVASNITGSYNLSLPADGARLVVQYPSGGTISYLYGRMLVDSIIADYSSGQPAENLPPRIKSLTAVSRILFINDSTLIYCSAEDPDGDGLTYTWYRNGEELSTTAAILNFQAAAGPGEIEIKCKVSDPAGLQDTSSVRLIVIDNHNPQIQSLNADPAIIEEGGTSDLECIAEDSDGDSLFYDWNAPEGIIEGNGPRVVWQAPAQVGIFKITCRVSDEYGGEALDSVTVYVGSLVLYYPFNGNAHDSSGFANHGTVNDATLVPDRFGTPNSAYLFDGTHSNITVSSHPSLDFRNAITVSMWMRTDEIFDREAYPISHGNWENRWKISVTNKKIRWTIKTDTSANNGIIDLDSQTEIEVGKYYNICTVFDGRRFEIYINGELNASSRWGGEILQTPIDLMIGQVLPGNTTYNFKGILDDIRIFNRGLSPSEVKELYDNETSIEHKDNSVFPASYQLNQNYPNPFNPVTTISFDIPQSTYLELNVYDVAGKNVATLAKGSYTPGRYNVKFEARHHATGIYFYVLKTTHFKQSHKMLLIR